MHRGAGRHAVGAETIAKQWGMSTKSSTFKLSMAALRSFGLIELDDAASSHDKMYKLTGDARNHCC